MPDGRVEFEITADGKKAYASIDEITKQLQKSGAQWEKSAKASTDSIGISFEGMLKKVTAAFSAAAIGKALVDFGKQAIEAASDLAEVQNVVDTTFGDKGAATIEAWAKKAGTQFGLTEIQAKRFTSTLGAMMKSSGLAGEEIVSMSTDMAGLAADMASFYNLDFDTAFQKIRSGISGETEPLKQLGINMSVANLEAFALQKGLNKTFNEMTQGEQVMLRYQYMMQATADAQGDFSKTADGFANATRRVETAIETIKAKAGDMIMNVVEPLTTKLAGFLEKLTTDPNRTVLDEFKEIDANTERKLAEITKTANDAMSLVSTLKEIEQESQKVKGNLDGTKIEIPDKTAENAESLANSLKTMNAQKSIKDVDIASENSTLGSSLKKGAENAEAIKSNLESIPDAGKLTLEGTALADSVKGVKDNAESIKDELKKVPEAGSFTLTGSELSKSVEGLKDNAGAVKSNLEGIPKAGELTLEGTKLSESVKGLQQNALTASNKIKEFQTTVHEMDAESVPQGVLGIAGSIEESAEAADSAANSSAEWLEVCKRLVQTIPGLTSIIDTQTGEIKGGTDAVYEYAKAWKEAQINLALIDANRQKNIAIREKENELVYLRVDKVVAEKHERDARKAVEEVFKKYNLDVEKIKKTYGLENAEDVYKINFITNSAAANSAGINSDIVDEVNKATAAYWEAKNTADEATKSYQTQYDAIEEAKEAIEEDNQILLENMTAEEKAALIVEKYAEAQQAAKDAVDAASAAVQDYRKNAIEKTTESVNKLISGFKEIKMPDYDELPKYYDLTGALETQLQFMQTYRENLEAAKKAGLDENLLAELSDGSEESAKYLQTIAENPSHINEINEAYRAVNAEKQTFAETLADNNLAVDAAYQELTDIEEKAKITQQQIENDIVSNCADSLDRMKQAIESKTGDISEAVNALNAVLAKIGLPSWSIGGFGLDGSFETGLPYVPFNGFLAELHEGEGILTAEENRIWQNFKAGQRGVDYDQLGGVMRDNIKPGGNVYLDSRIVGSVISEQQGKFYRQLQRSGWQG